MEASEVNQLLEGQTTLAREENGFKIHYVLPQEEQEDRERGFRVFTIGQPSDQPTRCILLMGETGAGRTTFINAVINYLFGVRFEDSFRLQVKEDTEETHMETESQTDLITAYVINHKEGMKHEYNYVFIDTPGLADTCGAQQQQDTRCRLKAFLTSNFGVNELSCVGLVAKASTDKNLDTEKAVLKEITSLLGDTVPDITHIIATHVVDKGMLDAVVKNVGVSFRSEFDNGLLFTPATSNTYSKGQDSNLSSRWDMSHQYETFFKALGNAPTVNLQILRETKSFDKCKKNLKAEIEKIATLVRAMDVNRKMHTKYELQKAKNEGWMQEETVEKKITVNVQEGLHALNCNSCQQTCMVFRYDNSANSSPERTPDSGAGGKSDLTANKAATVGALVTTAIPKSGLKNVTTSLRALGIDVGAQDDGVCEKFDMETARNTFASAEDLVTKGVKKGLKKRNKLQTFGIGVGVGALVAGGAAIGIYSFSKHKKNKLKKLNGGIGDEDSVCGKNGCSHTIKEHTQEDEVIVKENEVQKVIDENMKKLHDEAVSEIEKVNVEINNGQQEILNCSRNISQSTVDLLNYGQRIREQPVQDSDYIADLGSQLINEIRLGEPSIIPQAVSCVNILTEAMRKLISYTSKDVLSKHKLVEEMLLKDYEIHFKSKERQDTQGNY